MPIPDTRKRTSPSSTADSVAQLSGERRRVYDALTQDPTSLEELARLTGMAFSSLCGALESLAQAGLAHDAGGWWVRA